MAQADTVAEGEVSGLGDLVVVVEQPQGVIAPLIVAASVEVALALASANLLPGPAWILAALSTEGLAALRLPQWRQDGGPSLSMSGRVVFVTNGDEESLRAAQIAATRARTEAGWTVDVLPAPKGFSWADVFAGRIAPPEDGVSRIADLWVQALKADLRDIASEPIGIDDGRP